uniref:Tyrosine-protein kinase n=1 Tax=Oncorhynchus mykiss TaxID=8022 RepID=A0A8K9V1H0_ONCMY
MLPTVILKGTLIKKPQQKRRTSQKGCIELSNINCVEIVCSEVPIPCSNKYPFQEMSRISEALLLPPTPDPQGGVVVALQNYSPHEDTDLPLHKDQEYILTDSSHHNWWTVQDHRGFCTLHVLYIAEKSYCKSNFHITQEWHAGVYTVSVFTKKNPRVKHYQIRQSEAETSTFYLAEKYLFSTIPELIQYHQHNAAGIYVICGSPELPNTSYVIITSALSLPLPLFPSFLPLPLPISPPRPSPLPPSPPPSLFPSPLPLSVSPSSLPLPSPPLSLLPLPLSPSSLPLSLWSSPEVIKYCKFSSKSVWSFGVFMWEVYTEGRLPYENRSNLEVVEALNAGLWLLKPRQALEAVHLLMELCWKEKPDDRPSFALLLHELASLSDL